MTKKESQKKSSKAIKPAIKLAKEAKDKAVKGAKKIMEQLPKAVEKSPLLQNTLVMIAEMQHQAKSIKRDANEEVHKILEVLHSSYSDIESKAKVAKDLAAKQAKEGIHQLVAQWDKKKTNLPKKFTLEMDKLLESTGLRKKAPAKPKSAAKPKAKKTEATKPKAAAKKIAAKKVKAKRAAQTSKPATQKKLVIKKVTPTIYS